MDELKSHLVAVNPKYDEYADPLWSNGVKSVRQIAHASAESLQAMGVDDLDRAEIIHRDARLAGDAKTTTNITETPVVLVRLRSRLNSLKLALQASFIDVCFLNGATCLHEDVTGQQEVMTFN